eukprot:1245460-Pleurochrysis_carterae.AAC.2
MQDIIVIINMLCTGKRCSSNETKLRQILLWRRLKTAFTIRRHRQGTGPPRCRRSRPAAASASASATAALPPPSPLPPLSLPISTTAVFSILPATLQSCG